MTTVLERSVLIKIALEKERTELYVILAFKIYDNDKIQNSVVNFVNL